MTFEDPGAAVGELVAAAPVLFWVTDADGGCAWCNARWLELTGRPLAEQIGRGWLESVHPDDRARLLEAHDAARAERRPFRSELRLRRRDGEYRHVVAEGAPRLDAQGAVVGYACSCFDVTERRRTEEELRDAVERFRANADYTIDWESWIAPDGSLQWVNPAVFAMTGWSPEECVVMRDYPRRLIHPDDRAVADEVCAAHALRTRANDRELRLLRKDGSIGWAAISWQPLYASDGRYMGVRSSVRDISERRRAEQERLQHARERVARLEAERDRDQLRRERDVGERFVSLLSHDLRTPLSAAKATADLVARRAEDPAQVRALARRIDASLDRADRMLRDLLDTKLLRSGRALPVRRAPCDLEAVLREAVEELRTIYGERVELRSAGPCTGAFDASGLRRVVENLVANAVKYGHHTAPISVDLACGDGVATVAVHNEGEPIPASRLDDIFEPFQRGRERRDATGWGIGLTLVRAIVEAHGGAIDVTSDAERGTTFTVTLPCGRV